jgi:hypothetical protein
LATSKVNGSEKGPAEARRRYQLIRRQRAEHDRGAEESTVIEFHKRSRMGKPETIVPPKAPAPGG